MSKLTEQQSFLLRRLPNWYQARKGVEVPEPAEVKRARKIVELHQERVSRAEKDREKRFKKLLVKAREAVYFLHPDKALKVVQEFEAEFGTSD